NTVNERLLGLINGQSRRLLDRRNLGQVSLGKMATTGYEKVGWRLLDRRNLGQVSLGKMATTRYEKVGWSYSYCAPCERVWIREGNRSDVSLTQTGNGPEGTAAWGMSASRRKAHFELWVIGRAAFSDQGPGHKGPSTIQVRRSPKVTAMSRNLTHRPKRRANTR
nr:putative late blight resistance protein homolog R1B-16 [Tanacetum cinerariifolium]